MHRLPGAATLMTALALAAPVHAQSNISAATSRHQITPAPEPARAAQKGRATFFSLDVPATSRPLARGRAMLFGGWQPNERTMIGVGLFSVPKDSSSIPHDVRLEAIRNPGARTSRVAAVGMSFRF